MFPLFRPWRLLLILLLVLSGVGLAVSWAADRTVDSLKPRWVPPPSQFISLQGMQVHLRDEGPRDVAEPIVLMHGTSSSMHTWDGWFDALKAQRRVIRMDLPAFGLTGPNPKHHYSQDGYVAFVKDVMDALKVPKAIVSGNSLGSEIAWMLAVRHPERVSRLVLVDARGYVIPVEGMPIAFKVAHTQSSSPLCATPCPAARSNQLFAACLTGPRESHLSW